VSGGGLDFDQEAWPLQRGEQHSTKQRSSGPYLRGLGGPILFVHAACTGLHTDLCDGDSNESKHASERGSRRDVLLL
jgi:hypothetical protein